MRADAKTRGVPCIEMDGYLLLPQVPQPGLHNYYTHIEELCAKIKQDLKELRCWQAGPRVGGVKGYAPAPGRGVEVMNWHNLRASFHRWNPDIASMPEGAVLMWRELMKTREMTFTDDKSILCNPASWIWGETPGGATWCISGVCSERSQKVRTRQPSKQSQQQGLQLSFISSCVVHNHAEEQPLRHKMAVMSVVQNVPTNLVTPTAVQTRAARNAPCP